MVDDIQKDDVELSNGAKLADDIQSKIEKLEKDCEEYKNKYLRALADYQNLEKRVREERIQIRKDAQAELLLSLLSFIDNLEKATIFISDPGLQIIKKNFEEILKEYGLKELTLVGNEFDPYFAEAVDVVEGDKDNIITEVIRKGYRFYDRVLRPAQVKVSRKK